MNVTRFEDILEPRRREMSNYFYINRAIKTQVAVQMKPRPSPQSHQEAVLNSKKISELVTEISRKKNVKREEILNQLKLILEEIGYKKNIQIIRYLGYVLTKIFLKVSSGIYVNYEGLRQIKSQMGKCPVVFVPTHRSYADFIVFSYVMFHYDIEIPAIAAGMDFQGMMGMGEMLRNTGAFFMRRSYNDDSLYWSTFKEYVNQLVSKGDVPLEFFIEGTRSRSNKSIAPKYGLFNMILKSFFLSQVPDIIFVPVNVCYDRILEESLFAFELLGIPKPKESTSRFFKSLTILKESFGNIYFNFGEPISTRSFLENKLNKSQHSFGPIHLHEISEGEKKVIPPLAYEIIRRQQQCTIVTYTNLISLILSNNLTRGQQYTGFEQLEAEIRVLKQILQNWGATIFEKDVKEAVKECLTVQQKLLKCDNGKIGLVTNKISVGELNPNKLKAHVLSEDTISYSVPFIMLQLYTNPVLHYFVDAALIVIVLRSAGKMGKDELSKRFCTLRAIFAYEFVSLEGWFQMQFEDALLKLTKEKVISLQNGLYDIFENNYFQEVLISSLQPFVLSYYVAAEVLETVPEVVDEKTILSNVQRVLEDAISKKQMFIHPYCLTLDTLGNCLTSLAKMDIIKKTRRNNTNIYDINKDSVQKLIAELEIYIPSFYALKNVDILLHLKSKI